MTLDLGSRQNDDIPRGLTPLVGKVMSPAPMQVSEKRISPVVMELSVEVPATVVKAEVDKAYVNLGKKAHIKGFRPGKAPRDVLTRMFAPQVQNDVANAIVNDTLPKILSDKNLTPVSQPNVEAKGVDPKQPFSFTATFEVQPEIENVKFEGFELYRPKVEVDEKLVEEQLEGGDSRTVLKFPAALAPVKVAVLPLVKKDGMPEVAQRIVDELKYDYNVVYDEKDSVGKRYRRQDAIGTPFCVTVDGQTLEDGTVTVRHRDTMRQERVAIEALRAMVDEECSYRKLFRKLNL